VLYKYDYLILLPKPMAYPSSRRILCSFATKTLQLWIHTLSEKHQNIT